MIQITAEKRGNKVCLFAKLVLTEGNTSKILVGTPLQFSVAAVGNTKSVSGVRSVEPVIMLAPDDACRLARQILADCGDG